MKIKKVLFIAPTDSIHFSRWIRQLNGQKIFKQYLFPTSDIDSIDSELVNITIFRSFFANTPSKNLVPNIGINLVNPTLALGVRGILGRIFPNYRQFYLKLIVWLIKPDLIHVMSTQNAGYLLAQAYMGKHPPCPVAVTLFGNDLYFYGQIKSHQDLIRKVMTNTDYLFCEGTRDQKLAKLFGFKGEFLPLLPAPGGFNFSEIKKIKSVIPSKRKIVLVKGKQGDTGRPLFAIAALYQCVKQLEGFKIVVIGAKPDVAFAAEIFSKNTGVPVEIMPRNLPRTRILFLLSQSRIALSVSVSDGLPQTFVEAMALGAFPVQSDSCTVSDWLEKEKSCYLVSAENINSISMAIKKSLKSDELVDSAAKFNRKIVEKRMNYALLREKIISIYSAILLK